jgi:hypothetical protein
VQGFPECCFGFDFQEYKQSGCSGELGHMGRYLVILLLLVTGWVVPVWGGTYYVCPGTGGGDTSGSSAANCMADLDDLDASDPGTGTHTIIFGDTSGSATTFTDHTSDFDSWTGTYVITLDLNGCTFSGGAVYDSIFDYDEVSHSYTITSLTIQNGYMEDHDGLAGWAFIDVREVDNVTIDNVDINGHLNAGNHATGAFGMRIRRTNGTVTVKNCVLQNLGPKPISYAEVHAIYIQNSTTTNLQIYGNTIHDVGADGMHLKGVYDSSTRGAIYNNTIYDCYEEGIDLKGANYIDVYNNTLYRSGNLSDPDSLLNVLCTSTELSGYDARDIKIYENYFYDDQEGYAIQMNCTDPDTFRIFDIEIYDNYFANNKGAVVAAYWTYNIDIYRNVVANTNGTPEAIFKIMSNLGGHSIVSNSIYSDEATYAIMIENYYGDGTDIVEANAIDLSHASAYAYYDENSSAPFTPDWNTWDNSGGNEVWINGANNGSLGNNYYEDPGFYNPSSGDLTLDSNSNAIGNAGGSNETSSGLNYKSTWTPTFSITTVTRDGSPDAGAYEYENIGFSGVTID